MTSLEIPDWARTPWPGIHDVPGEFVRPQPPMSQAQLQATVRFMLDTVIGQIAIAFGGINILGWKPLEFLADWGRRRIVDARNAYEQAVNAQAVATNVQKQLAILIGGSLATDVPGGVAVSNSFSGAAADNLGAQFARRSDGAGAGGFGPNGNGQAEWKASGGRTRRHFDVCVTQHATDYVAAIAVVTEPIQSPKVGLVVGPGAYTYLTCRSNASASSFVYFRLGYYDLVVGCMNSGGAWTPWRSVTLGDQDRDTTWLNRGDQIIILAGIGSNLRQFVLRQNGIERISYTDTANVSLTGSGFRACGIISEAAERNLGTAQTRPIKLDAWSSADRQPNTLPG